MLNNEMKADVRIRIAKISGFAAFLASTVMTMMSSIGIANALYCVLAYLGFYIVNLAGYFVVRKDNSILLLYAILSGYIWIAYILKFSLIMFDPELFLGLDSPAGLHLYYRTAIPTFLVLSPALMLFIIGLWFGPASKADLTGGNPRLPGEVNVGLLFLAVFTILILRLVGQVVFDVGSPIKMGHGLPRFVLALYEYFVQDAAIVLLNVLFFTALYMRIKRGVILVSVALIANVALVLSAGWKSGLVLQALTLIYYIFEIRHRVPKKTMRMVVILSALFISSMLIIYPYVNQYRWASSQGLSIEEAISKASESEKKNDEQKHSSGLFKIFERIDGASTYISIVELGKGKDFTFMSLWGNEFGNMVKYQLYGAAADDVMVQFSTTQFAAIYLVGGWGGLYIGSFFMGVIFRVTTSLLENRVLKYATTFHAYLPLLCFTWLAVLVSGGRIGVILKEFFVVIVSVMVLERLVFREKKVRKPRLNMGLAGNDNKVQSRILKPASQAGSGSDGAV